MVRCWLMLTAALFAGCAQAPNVVVEQEQPASISTDFGRLPSVLEGIGKSAEVVLYEGLPSEFWEPQVREQELNRKKTIKLHDYAFYDDRIALPATDVERFTTLLSSKALFKRYRGQKACGDYHPDYCVEWKPGEATTRALICMECGEVKFFGPRSELHSDLIPEAGEKLTQWLRPYQRNRPAAATSG
jgi:hypothetical protein